jgi:hypothetical protein
MREDDVKITDADLHECMDHAYELIRGDNLRIKATPKSMKRMWETMDEKLLNLVNTEAVHQPKRRRTE